MYFSDFNSLLMMDGHGPYVWAAYGIGLLILLWNLIAPLLRNRAVIAEVRRAARRDKSSRRYSAAVAETPQPELTREAP